MLPGMAAPPSQTEIAGHVLIVDDSELVVDLVAMTLEELNWNVQSATSASKALAILERDPTIEVVVCDLHMPEMSGFEVIERVASLRSQVVPVIMLSDEQDLSAVLRAVRQGAFDYVPKASGDFSPLIAAIERAADHHRLLVQNETLRAELAAHVNELRRAHEDALAASQAKSAFLAGMSHELRTPLNAIINYAELIGEDAQADGNATLQQDAQRIYDAGHHLLHLINDVLMLARLDSEDVELHPQTISIPTLCQSLFASLRAQKGGTTNTLVLDLPDDLAPVITDHERLRLILRNLLDNANTFTEQGTITLSAHQELRGDQRWTLFEIRDTGIGMPPEQLKTLFEAFTQGESGLARSFGGLGLGLTLCHRLIGLLDGQITVESELGVGTCVQVAVPDP